MLDVVQPERAGGGSERRTWWGDREGRSRDATSGVFTRSRPGAAGRVQFGMTKRHPLLKSAEPSPAGWSCGVSLFAVPITVKRTPGVPALNFSQFSKVHALT